MAHDIFAHLGFPKQADMNVLDPEFIVDWDRAEGVRAFFEAINGHPYDEWEHIFSLVPYHDRGTILSLSSDGKNITIQMPRGHTEFEYKAVQILIDLKSSGYAFAGIVQNPSNTTEIQDLFACARQIYELDKTCNSQENRNVIIDSLRKLVSGDRELELASAESLGRICDHFSRTYQDLLDPVSSTAESIVKLFAGIISGTTQLEALLNNVRGKTARQLESLGVNTWPTQYWLTYAQRMDQTLAYLDLSVFDVWQACWIEVQCNFGNIISQTQALRDTFLAVDLDHRDGLVDLVARSSDIIAQFWEIFELADKAMLIVRQFVEAEERMKDIFWGIDCGHPITSFPIQVLTT